MADAWNSFRIRQFEHLLAGRTVALLRVSGRPLRRRLATGPRPVLLADDGQAIQRFVAIPAPPDERGILRVAYSVPADLALAASISFSLQLADGTLVALPAPQPGRARLIPEPSDESAPEAAEDPEPPEGIDERRSGLVSKLTELSARVAGAEQARGELEQSVVSLKGASERLEHELIGARARAARAQAAAETSASALEELDTWRAELERRLTETTDELSAARAAATNEEAAVIRLGGKLAEAVAKAELLQAQVRTLTGAAGERAGARAPHLATEDSLAVARAEIDELRAQLAHARDAETQAQLEALRFAAEAEAHQSAERELALAQAAPSDD